MKGERTVRVENSIKNISTGILSQGISIILAFATRTVFIYTLGAEYLGVEGLFSNILSLLSLTNLGMETAVIYSLYKPLKENNLEEIKGYVSVYGKIYRYVGVLTLILGLMILPFLGFFIKGEVMIKENIITIYIMFLLNSALSYFCIYKKSVLMANQQNYLISSIHIKYIFVTNLIQIGLLLLFKTYIIVLILQLVLRIMENISTSHRADKEFPCLRDKGVKGELSERKKRDLFKNVYSIFLYKISGTIINSTDNILISKFIGIIQVGIYSNYLLIISTLKTLLSYVFYSLTSSIGNLMVSDENEHKEFIFNEIFFMSFWTYGFSSICLYILINDFIGLCFGEMYVLDNITVAIIIADFYTAGMQSASTTYRDTSGLFGVGKYRPLIAASLNLIISILLAVKLQIAGIILGTIISRLMVYFWFDPYVIHKYLFNKGCKEYFLKYIYYTFIVVITGFVTFMVTSLVTVSGQYIRFVIKMIICAVLPNLTFYLFSLNKKEFKYLKAIGLQYLKKYSKTIKGILNSNI